MKYTKKEIIDAINWACGINKDFLNRLSKKTLIINYVEKYSNIKTLLESN